MSRPLRLYLLRHGEVASHRGDVPITAPAERHSFDVGQALGGRFEQSPVRLLTGETRRASETATHLARGLTAAGCEVIGPDVAFALRNPDLYLAGARVNMVSSAEALAEQVDGLTPGEVSALEFFPEFIESADRIGWWLSHDSPPGEGARAVANRMRWFAASLNDPAPDQPGIVVAVTHSPLLRAVGLDFLGRDIGEPPWVSGLLVTVGPDAELMVDVFEEALA